MVQQQTLSDYTSSVPATVQSDQRNAGYFAAVKLDDFSAESLSASKVYSRKDFYKISLITGHGIYHYLDRKYLFEPGGYALVFTNSEIPYRWEVLDGTCSGYACMFTEDFLPLHTYRRPSDWVVFNPDGQSVFRLSEEAAVVFKDLFLRMINEQSSSYTHKYDLLFLYVLECIHGALKLEPAVKAGKHSAGDRLTESFKTLLAGQFPLVTPLQQVELRTAQAFADKLAVHTNYLNRALKAVTGKSTTQLITERIMQEARALLLHSNWSVSQISDSLGFDEPTHFTHAFRKHTGQTPSALRD